MARKKRPLPVSDDFTIIVREPRNPFKKQPITFNPTIIQTKRHPVLSSVPFARNFPRKGDAVHRRLLGEGCPHVAPDKSLEEPGPSGVTQRKSDIEVHVDPLKKKNRLFEPLAQLRIGVGDNRKLKCCVRCNASGSETVIVEVNCADNKSTPAHKPDQSAEQTRPDVVKPAVDKLLERQKRFATQPVISLLPRTAAVESASVSDRTLDPLEPTVRSLVNLPPTLQQKEKTGFQKKDIHKVQPDPVPTQEFTKRKIIDAPTVFPLPVAQQEEGRQPKQVHSKIERSPKKEGFKEATEEIVNLDIPDFSSEGTCTAEMKLGKRITFPGRNFDLEGEPLLKKRVVAVPIRAPSPSLPPHLQNPPTKRIVAAFSCPSTSSAEYIELKAEPKSEPKPEPLKRETIRPASPPRTFADRLSKPTYRKEEFRREKEEIKREKEEIRRDEFRNDDFKKEVSPPEHKSKINFLNPRVIKGKDGKKLLPFFTNKYVFSNHFPCPGLLINGKKYCCAEQYYMWRKAKFARNEAAAGAIYMSTDPKQMKLIGSSLGDYDAREWKRVGWKYMLEANYAKYQQFDELRFQLLRTIGTTLVEANPTDKYWGVGLNLDSSNLNDPSKWNGKNVMGSLLMEIRDAIQEKHKFQHDVVKARRSLIVNDL